MYQVRNYDASQMTIIESDNGIIIIDPSLSIESTKAGLELYHSYRKGTPPKIKAVIHSHSHAGRYLKLC